MAALLSGLPALSWADTFAPAGVVAGQTMERAGCRWPDTSVWVVVEGRGECLRYFHAGLKPRNAVVHVWFHGDRLARRWDRDGRTLGQRVIGYGSPDAEDLRARAARDHRGYGVPYIRLSRPGVYGSSGDHKERRRPREVALVDAALDALKQKYRIERFALSGQSGGGHLVAALLAFRDDVACAVVTSGVVAVRERIAARGWAARGWTTDSTGYADFLDPMDLVARIPRDRNRRIYIVGDPRDTNVPFESQVAYHRALVAAGHDARLIRARALDRARHSLSPLGFRVMSGCLEGVPAPEIAARAADWSR